MTSKIFFANYSEAFTTDDGQYLEIPFGQKFRMLTPARCRSTGLLQNDGSEAWGDKGFLYRIQIVGGPNDGAEGEVHDAGGLNTGDWLEE